MPLFPGFSNTSNQRRWFYVPAVLLLAVAQLFSTFHSVEHLDEHEGEEHAEHGCTLCILTTDLQNNTPVFNRTLDMVEQRHFVAEADFAWFFFHSPGGVNHPRAPPGFPQFS